MRNLYLFFRKHYFFFLFLILELVSLILFFQLNTYPNAAVFRWTSSIAGSVGEIRSQISVYFSLVKTNRMLSHENTILKARMPEAIYLSDTHVYYRDDTILQIEYRFIDARVINNTTHLRNNYLMISKGKMQGIEPYMGVISEDKIVGQVVSVSRHFSWIMSTLHKSTRLSGKIQKNSQLVSVEWPGISPRRGLVREIPKHIRLYPGDTIITSGNSEIYPEGIRIGTIEEVQERPDENFNTATLTFLTDFNSLEFVQVVVDMFRKEKMELKASFKEL